MIIFVVQKQKLVLIRRFTIHPHCQQRTDGKQRFLWCSGSYVSVFAAGIRGLWQVQKNESAWEEEN
jgi:hypothetical protein